MPLDLYAHYNGADHADAVRELRHSLIGNTDLKLRLLSDPAFLAWFVAQLAASLDVLALDPLAAAHTANLHAQLVVLRILAKFAGSRPELAAPLEQFAPLVARTLRHVADVCVPHMPAGGDTVRVEQIVCDALYVALVLAAGRPLLVPALAPDAVYKLLSTLLLVAGTGDVAMKSVVVAAFRFLPLCLELGPRDATPDYAAAVLTVALRRLHAEFARIYAFYFAAQPPVADNFAPNVFPDPRLLRDNFDMPLLATLVTGVAQILNYFKDAGARPAPAAVEARFFAAGENYFCMLFLLGCDAGTVTSVAALNLIKFYLAGLLDAPARDDARVYSTFEKLFPRIVELLDYDYDFALLRDPIPKYLQLPVSVLSDLCLKYSDICVHLRNTNVDYKIMHDLDDLFKQVGLFRQLHSLKLSSDAGTKLADFTVLKRAPEDTFGHEEHPGLQEAQLDSIANYILLLSVFTSSNEEFRRRITGYQENKSAKLGPNFLCLMIFEIIDNYRFMLRQMLLNYKLFAQWQAQPLKSRNPEFLSWFGRNIGVLYTLLDHPVYSNTFYLVRSLSRSVSTLRTFFVDCNSIKSAFVADDSSAAVPASKTESIIDIAAARYDRDISFDRQGSFISSILDILSKFEELYAAMQFFTLFRDVDDAEKTKERKSLCVKKVIVLASIANFVLDFSSFRYEIVNHATLLRDLATILKNSIKAKQEHDHLSLPGPDARECAFEQLRVQIAVLQVIKNYLYNENEENRKFVWDFVPLSTIFEMSLYGTGSPTEEDSELHKLQLQNKVIAFEIMRNLTAASSYFSEAIKELYLEFVRQQLQNGCNVPQTWNEYLLENLMSFELFMDGESEMEPTEENFFKSDEFVLRIVQIPDYVRLVVGINYLEDHRYTNISSFYRANFPHNELLNVWKRFLEVRLLDKVETKICGSNTNQKVKLANQLNEIKVSIDWILINLTWKEEDYGYQMPDKVSFRLLDTVLGSSMEGNTSSNLFTASNIVIEESEDEDEEEKEENVLASDSTILTPETRAKMLHRHGFSAVLQRMIYEMSTPRSTRRRLGRRSPLERFDQLNSNDLFEKSKTAHQQIVLLVSGGPAEHAKLFRVLEIAEPEGKHPLRRSSNIISSRESARIRRDVNRGGEGFGYGSDEEYLNDDAADRPEIAEVPAAEENEDEMDEHWIR